MTWQQKPKKWPWQDFLTDEEWEVIARADEAQEESKRLNAERALIRDRARKRAQYHAEKK